MRPLTGIAKRTGAMVIVDQIEARAAVSTLVERTVVQIFAARLAAPALLALALEAAGRIVAGHRIDARPQQVATATGATVATVVVIVVVDVGAFVEICLWRTHSRRC